MGLMTGFKANKAYRLQKNGDSDEAIRLYEECFAEGMNDARFNLAYALLIIRKGEYQKAKEFLVKHQKTPGMTPDQRTTLLVDYAACCYRLGDLEKGIATLEQQFRKGETGLLYQTLGCLYVEQFDPANREAFLEKRAAEIQQEAEAEEARRLQAEQRTPDAAEAGDPVPPVREAESEPAAEGEAPAAPKAKTPEEAWQEGMDKAEEFIRRSIEYDEEDAVCLDNMGQFLYRVRGDKAAAKPWFDKAHEQKESQIDTLWFLSRYDLDAGDTKAAAEKLEKLLEGRFSPLNYATREMAEKELERLKGAN